MNSTNYMFPDVKICRMGQYAALMVNGAMIELKDYRVAQSMEGANEVMVVFDVPNDLTEIKFSTITDERPHEKKPDQKQKYGLMDLIQKWNGRFI